METELITPSEAKAMFPLMDESNFVGAMWDPVASGDAATGCVLNHAMGLGKTVQIAALLVAYFGKTGHERLDQKVLKDVRYRRAALSKPHEAKSVLILCPSVLVDNWMRELARWGVFRVVERTDYGAAADAQLAEAHASSGGGNLHDLLHSLPTWEVH